MSRSVNRYPPAYGLLDAWRGVAGLAVVVFHAGEVAAGGRGAGGDWALRAAGYGYLGVPLFFVISGYCIAGAAVSSAGRADGGPWRFMVARGRRIYPTYWAAVGLMVVAVVAAARLAAAGRLAGSHLAGVDLGGGWEYWAANLGLVQPAVGCAALLAVSWTLSYELAFYAVAAAGLWAARRTGRPGVILWLSHGLTAACLVTMTAGVRLGFPLDLYPAFGFGVAGYDLLTGRGGTSRGWSAAVLAGLLGLGLVLPAVRGGAVGATGEPVRLAYPVAVGFTLVLVGLRPWDGVLGRWVRPLSWVGVASYSLYLTHFLVLGVVHQATRHHPALSAGPVVQMAVSGSVAVGFGFAFWAAFERPLRPRHQGPVAAAGGGVAGPAAGGIGVGSGAGQLSVDGGRE